LYHESPGERQTLCRPLILGANLQKSE